MKRYILPWPLFALVMASLCVPFAAKEPTHFYSPVTSQTIPGRPWTSLVPDPDKYDWSTKNGNRPGYRYRGMLPMQQKFYDYVQQKQRKNIPLSWAEQATVRWLITSRRWPEAPKPNQFWASFMRYLRDQTTTELNIAQNLMLDQLVSRGLVAQDLPPNRNLTRIRDYLNSGPFQSRNWFERTFGRVEPWMDNLYAGYGLDLGPAAPSGNSYPPGDPFNGLKVSYNVSGATLSAPTDKDGFTISRSYSGVLGTGTLAVSGTYRVGGFGADVTISVWAGDKKADKKVYTENTGSAGNPQSFSLSVPIPAGARTGGFAIRLDGRYSMGGGHRGCYVTGDFGPSKAQLDADRAAADAKWRQEVEDTLRRLGYENTPEGKEVEAMRRALAGGDAAWRQFVNQRLDQMKGDTSPQAMQFRELEEAMSAGGSQWDDYVAAHGGSGTPTTTNPAGATALIKQGQSAYEKRDYPAAIAAFTRAIEANPKSAAAYAGRGLAKYGQKDASGALADFNRAIEIDPNNSEAYRGRSMVKRSQNDLNGALADADRAISLAPSGYSGYLTRGLAREELKDLAGAQSDYDRSIGINPNYANSFFYRARVRYDRKDYRGALSDYNKFLQMAPNDSAAYNNRGLAKEELGDTAGALADFEKAVSLNPDSANAKKNLARLKPGATQVTEAPSGNAGELVNTGNIYAVGNRPTAATTFTINQTYRITSIFTYHWNDGRGTRTGTIALRDANGRMYGPWPAIGTPGQGGVPNANWTCTPNVNIPAGTYTIVDSEPATWSQNSASGGRGMAIVKGYPAGSASTTAPTNQSNGVTISALLENKSSENVHIFVEGDSFGSGNRLAPGESRRVNVPVPATGRIRFIAGRNGQVLDRRNWDGDPSDARRFPHIIFSAENRLLVTTGLR